MANPSEKIALKGFGDRASGCLAGLSIQCPAGKPDVHAHREVFRFPEIEVPTFVRRLSTAHGHIPDGIQAISRWLSAATPPVPIAVPDRIPKGCQRPISYSRSFVFIRGSNFFRHHLRTSDFPAGPDLYVDSPYWRYRRFPEQRSLSKKAIPDGIQAISWWLSAATPPVSIITLGRHPEGMPASVIKEPRMDTNARESMVENQ